MYLSSHVTTSVAIVEGRDCHGGWLCGAGAPARVSLGSPPPVCSKLGVPCRVLDRRAIENYFPQHAFRTVKKSDKYHSLGPYEAVRGVQPAWGKEENWKIARLMKEDDLKDTDLGRFLEEL